MLNNKNNNKDTKYIYINVFLYDIGWVNAGVITFNLKQNYSSFSYFTSYIDNDYPPLNPATLNYRDNLNKNRHFIVSDDNNQLLDRTFWELLPQQNDWGHKILISKYPHYNYLTNVEKLYFLQKRTVGGLQSFVEDEAPEFNIDDLEWLDKVREESIDFYMQSINKIRYTKAINPMIAYGGIRPKCMFEDENGDFWIAKFNLPTDNFNMAKAELLSLIMSKEMGLKTAESKVITLDSGEDVFLSKRFDITEDSRYHSLSFFALAPAVKMPPRDTINKIPGNPSSYIQTIIRRFSDFENRDSANMVLKFLLDITVNNTDNHLRNLRLILNKKNKWELAPIFDVTCNPYNQPHVYNPLNLSLSQTYLNNPNIINVLSNELNVSTDMVENKLIIAKEVSNRWEDFCDNIGVSPEDKNLIGNAMSLGRDRKDYEIKNILEINKKINISKPKPKI